MIETQDQRKLKDLEQPSVGPTWLCLHYKPCPLTPNCPASWGHSHSSFTRMSGTFSFVYSWWFCFVGKCKSIKCEGRVWGGSQRGSHLKTTNPGPRSPEHLTSSKLNLWWVCSPYTSSQSWFCSTTWWCSCCFWIQLLEAGQVLLYCCVADIQILRLTHRPLVRCWSEGGQVAKEVCSWGLTYWVQAHIPWLLAGSSWCNRSCMEPDHTNKA